MKNLLIYTSPKKEFSEENKKLVKVQIDNSLDLGWKRSDILLFTNFPYEYNGVKSTVIPNLCYKDDPTNKIPAIIYLLDNGLIPEGVIWYHDFDAYQEQPFNLEMEGDLALTPYGYKPEWNCGSIFFKRSAYPLFFKWNLRIKPRSRADEKAMNEMIRGGFTEFKELDVSYNFTFRYVHRNYKRAELPLKVIHFHPEYKDVLMKDKALDIFLGKNKLKIPLISKRLLKIFKKHGI